MKRALDVVAIAVAVLFCLLVWAVWPSHAEAARLRVIVLDQVQNDGEATVFRVALWADVPAGRQTFYATLCGTCVSAWKDATGTDNTNLQSGSVVEKVYLQRVQKGTGIAAVELIVQAAWSDYQASITANNPWVRYGTQWDGTTWTLGGAL